MSRRSFPSIVMQSCPRCRRPVAGLSGPIYGSDAGHAKYAGLCSRCVSAEEQREIDQDIEAGVVESLTGEAK